MPLVLNSSSITGLAAVGGLSSPQTGSVIQVVQNTTIVGTVSTTSTSFVDITNATASITPSSITSKILVLWTCRGGNNLVGGANVQYQQKLLRASTELYSGSIAAESGSGGLQVNGMFAFSILDAPSSTSSVTYKIQHAVNNGSSTGTAAGGFLTLMEIAA